MARLPHNLEKRVDAVEEVHAAKTRVRADPTFVDPVFPHQQALLEDSSALLCVLCTRRAAKSFSAAKRLLRAMYKHPGCSVLFIGLTRDSAKKILWKDVLRKLNKTERLHAKFNKSELTMTLPNGSVLYLLGVDTDEAEKEKLLGQKYAEVAIDESASYSIDLHSLVYNTLKPAVADYRGTIGLYGTPSNIKAGIFYDLTEHQNPSTPSRWQGTTEHEGVTYSGWSGHCWSTFQNPYMADLWKQEIADLIRDNPLIESTPGYQQNYLGIWVIDDSKLVYKYMPVRNDFNGTLPHYRGGEWHFVLGIDLGFRDATSFTVMAYHDQDRTLYVLSSTKKAKLDITAKAEVVAELKKKWIFDAIVIDGANAEAVAELNNRHGLNAVPASKRDKFDFIAIMNDELIQERIKLAPDCQALKDEYEALVIDERKLLKARKLEENPKCENHCADSTLYGWRHCYQFLSVAPVQKPKPGTVAHVQAQNEATLAELELINQQEREAIWKQEENERNDEY